MDQSLRILNWNAHSLANKKLELLQFFNEHHIDVAVLTETHLKPEVNFCLPDHSFVRLDRTTSAGGGVAIAVRKGLAYKSLPSFNTTFIEAVGIEVITTHGPLTIVAVYCPTQSRRSNGSNVQLKNDIQKLSRRNSSFVIAGDLNARHTAWGDSRCNSNGNVIVEDSEAGYYYPIHPDQPTFISRNGVGSKLDIFLTNITDRFSIPQTITELSSDHLPVVAEIGAVVERRQVQLRRNYHRANWVQLQRFVESHLNENPALDSTEDIDQALQSIVDVIKEAENRFVPLVPVTRKFTVIDENTKRIISLRNAMRRRYQRTLNPRHCYFVKQLTKIVRDRLEKVKNRQFASEISKLPKLSRPFWRVAKVLKSKPKPIPPLIVNEQKFLTNREKACVVSKHFSASHNLGRDIISPMEPTVSEAVRNLDNVLSELPRDKRISVEEVKNNIKFSRNMKAPGMDGVFNLVLKKLGPSAYSMLTKVLNRCLELAYFPNQWKLAKVVPVLKPGKDPTCPKSYRPISLLSALSKVFERCIYNRILCHTELNEILLDEQFGFRRGHSTTYQLQRVTNIINRNKHLSKTTVMACLDIEKAFDNVWHNGLIYKMIRFNFPIYLVKMIQSYLLARKSQVCVIGELSDPYDVEAGVPQGSILGPILYNLFTSDIPALPDDGILSLFADDTAIVYAGRQIKHVVKKLQNGLNAFVEYLTTWKICVNAAKTQTIVFPHRNSQRLEPTTLIQLNGVDIPWSSEVSYLGLTYDRKLLYRSHVDRTVSKSTIILKKLYPLINRRSKLSVVNKLAVYKQVVLPMLLYAASVWVTCARTHRQKVQRVQNKFLKMIFNVPHRTRTTVVHRLASIDTVEDSIALRTEKIKNSALNSDAALIRELYI